MKLVRWEKLPQNMQNEEVKVYYDILSKKKTSLYLKRVFDIVVSFVMLLVFFPIFLLIAVAIKFESKGPVFYRQERVTQYGEIFKIFKFRTMKCNADKQGQITIKNDKRITRVGKFLRKTKLDEICQIIDVFRGKLSFVGTRPEVKKYVDQYTPEMMATLLLPAGITSEASVCYKDENSLIDNADNVDDVYIKKILPQKMEINLSSIKKFSFWRDIKIMFMTFFAVLGKKYTYKKEQGE